MTRTPFCILAVLAVLAAVAAGCGGERTDVSQGIDEFNTQVLQPQGAQLDCPDEVDGGEGTTFDCTVKSTKGDESAPVQMKIVTENGELKVDVADQAKFNAAVKKVAA